MVLVLVEGAEKVVCVRLRVSSQIVYNFRVGIWDEYLSIVTIRVHVAVESRFLQDVIHGSCISRMG
jgi:hypothetical protein